MLAAPEILSGNHVLCGAETGVCVYMCVHVYMYVCARVCVRTCVYMKSCSVAGSGKTLAYLAPVMQRLKDEEETVGTMARVNRPRAIILCPSRELASQVLVSISLITTNYKYVYMYLLFIHITMGYYLKQKFS